MSPLYDRDLYAAAIFDVQDRFLADRKISSLRPRPLGTVQFMVTARQKAGQFQPLPKPCTMQIITNPSGYRLFFGQVVAETIVYRLTPGVYQASILSDYYLPVTVDFSVFTLSGGNGIDLAEPADLNRSTIPVDLEPALAYPFPARTTRLYGAYLRLAGQDGRVPVPNVNVQAFNADGNALSGVWTTNPRGDWLLIFKEAGLTGLPEVEDEMPLPDGTILSRMVIPVSIRFTPPDGGGIYNEQINIVRYTENTFPPKVFNGE